MYKLDDTLAIQVLVNTLYNEAVGRYLNDPKNFKKIKDCLFDALDGLYAIRAGSEAAGEDPVIGCPVGWEHDGSCACRPGRDDEG